MFDQCRKHFLGQTLLDGLCLVHRDISSLIETKELADGLSQRTGSLGRRDTVLRQTLGQTVRDVYVFIETERPTNVVIRLGLAMAVHLQHPLETSKHSSFSNLRIVNVVAIGILNHSVQGTTLQLRKQSLEGQTAELVLEGLLHTSRHGLEHGITYSEQLPIFIGDLRAEASVQFRTKMLPKRRFRGQCITHRLER